MLCPAGIRTSTTCGATGSYEKLGQTRDDAAGEAYDKVAKLLGLGYPGGPVIDRLAKAGDPAAIKFPRTYLDSGSLDFSFSGLKTAVLNHVRGLKTEGIPAKQVADICASFQAAVVDVLVKKTVDAARKTGIKNIVVAGGVASNSALRESMIKAAEAEGRRVFIPSPGLCSDNAAMVAAAGFFLHGMGRASGLDMNPQANLPLERMVRP